MEWLTHLTIKDFVSFLSGGLAGTIITNYLSWRRQKTDLSFKVLEQYFARRSEMGEILGLLNEPEELQHPEKRNRVVSLGDWFEVVATLYGAKMINTRLLRKVGIDDEIKRFRSAAEKAGEPMQKALDAWCEMRKLM